MHVVTALMQRRTRKLDDRHFIMLHNNSTHTPVDCMTDAGIVLVCVNRFLESA